MTEDNRRVIRDLGQNLALFFRPTLMALFGGIATWIASFFFASAFVSLAALVGFDLASFGFFSFGACLGFLSSFLKPSVVNVRKFD